MEISLIVQKLLLSVSHSYSLFILFAIKFEEILIIIYVEFNKIVGQALNVIETIVSNNMTKEELEEYL